MKYGRFTRVLHRLIAIGIVLQLVLSLLMRTPRPGRVLTPLQSFGFEAHGMIGMAVLAVLAVHWLVFLSGHAYKGMGHFFPWFSADRRREVVNELRELLKFKLADPEQKDSLAGAMEGLGIVIGSILAVSGAVLFFGIAASGEMSQLVRGIREFHEFWGPLMWGYLIIHTGAVVAHLALGHRSILSIFR